MVRNPRRRRLFVTTNTEDKAIAAAATSGFSNPAIATGIARACTSVAAPRSMRGREERRGWFY